MSAFPPIAIVARSCFLPGARSPAMLFEAALKGVSVLSRTPDGRWSGIDPAALLRSSQPGMRVASLAGGYIVAPPPANFVAERIAAMDRLDPLVHWLAHCAAEVLTGPAATDPDRCGLIVGNLSYPSRRGAAFVEGYWRGEDTEDPRNRFSSGLPVHLVAGGLGFGGPAFALDGACASSLYAIKLACDALHDGETDFMIAGGVNGADDLFIHLGFTALQALSPSGRSRPLHTDADGLVPSEGCALVALKRLDDAVRAGDRVFGVIRGIGVGNDGRQNGFLAPAVDGQARAMQAAFAHSGFEPRDIGFVECHATGTARGDATEIESLSRVYGDTPLLLGALKGVLGHAITASGAASVITVLSSFEAGLVAPTMCDMPIAALRDTPFDLPQSSRQWPAGRKRAAISNFGFGGNNAHLLLEEYQPEKKRRKRSPRAANREDLAICGAGVIAGDTRGLDAFRRRLFAPVSPPHPAVQIELALDGLGFPPSDLKASLAQQTAMIEVVTEALSRVDPLPADRTGVFVGMGCDATIARHGMRVRAGEASRWSEVNEEAAPRLTAQGVLGTMPNMPANRIHAQRDYRGFGFTVSSEDLSGVTALGVAARALRAGELDAAIVGAADFGCEPAHAQALARTCGDDGIGPGDAAVALVLKRRSDAETAGDTILGFLGEAMDEDAEASGEDHLARRFGHTHAARSLLQVLTDALILQSRVNIDASGAQPAGDVQRLTRAHPSFSGQRMTTVAMRSRAAPMPVATVSVPVTARFAARTREELVERVSKNLQGGEGPFRCGLVSDACASLEKLRDRTASVLRAGDTPSLPGAAFAERTMEGELAFTFTGAAAAYPGAAREIMLAFPEIGDALSTRHGGAGRLMAAFYGAEKGGLDPRVQLTGCALVCQAHAEFSRQTLRLKPVAAIGLSSGETNALLAFGVWRDLDAMLAEIDGSGLYGKALTGALEAAARTWGLSPDEKAEWTCWRVSAPQADVEAALAREPRAYMTIVQAPDDCVIGGDPAACRRVVDAIGNARAAPLGLDMIVHCDAMTPFADQWRKIHSREVFSAGDIRFYSNAHNSHYAPTRESAADAITRQALNPIDFPKTVRAAWDDGVRVFVEHGPRAILTGAVSKILEGRPHLAVALDSQERRGLRALCESVFKLWTHGVDLDVAAFERRLEDIRRRHELQDPDLARKLILPAHPPPIVTTTSMPSATVGGGVASTPRLADVGLMERAPDGLPTLGVFRQANAAPQPRSGDTPPRGPREAALNLVGAVGAAHRAFMDRQARVHETFLQSRLALTAMAARPASGAPGSVARQPYQARTDLQSRPPAPQSVLYTREQLEVLASGRVSDVFGPLFERQDGYARQVRMPQPPLLLADRVTVLEGEPGGMGKGRIVTETDVNADAWYMHAGRMSPGAVIESGQADLLLASWLGADFLNCGERVYRLLGCELTFMGELPKPGETLRYDIHIDSHASNGDTRLFFFHYDCSIGDRVMISVRNGQAGFFSDAELAHSGGVLWRAEDDAASPTSRRDAPPQVTTRRAFDRAALDAFVDGDAFGCFGPGFELAAAHVRTPTVPGGRLRLLDEVTTFEPDGGPWGRGYLKARAVVPVNAWFYDGHFKNDPCMPGTLMADAATQALSFAMAAYGFTIARDGWRFEPAPGEMSRFVCRGQVTPDAEHMLEYEVFIEEIVDGPEPLVVAALLCRSDGFKVFHCRRFGMRLVPDWPMAPEPGPASHAPPRRIVGQSSDVRGDYAALLACARGKPSDAFGAMYGVFDGARRAPRLPGEPYHFISRVLSVEGVPAVPVAGHAVVTEYDVPSGAWYFHDSGSECVPLSVLTEVLLQPCGWLASYMGFAANRVEDVAFRNLDGAEVLLHRSARVGVIRVTARLDRFADAGGATVVFFNVTASQQGELVMTMKTAFGFFNPVALRGQSGLPVTSGMRERLSAPGSDSQALARQSTALLCGAGGRLKLLDAITGFWPDGGAQGLGRAVGQAVVDPAAWFFKAHFFQDPVQPGSLGLEALQQTLRAAILLKGSGDRTRPMTFAPLAAGRPFSWKFRGQILPTNRQLITEFDILQLSSDDGAVTAFGDGSVWVDGVRIYEVKGMGARLGPAAR